MKQKAPWPVKFFGLKKLEVRENKVGLQESFEGIDMKEKNNS